MEVEEPPSTLTTEYVALLTFSTQTTSLCAVGSPDDNEKSDDSANKVKVEVLRRMIALACKYVEMDSRTIT